jgi:hypothetical protein
MEKDPNEAEKDKISHSKAEEKHEDDKKEADTTIKNEVPVEN